MDSRQAREILSAYRHNTEDASDPYFAEALQEIERDPQLKRWFEQQRLADAALRDKFQQIDVPANLPESILQEHKIVRPAVWWRKPAWIAAAALVVIALVSASLIALRSTPVLDAYRKEMVTFAMSGYHMDIRVTGNEQLKETFAQKRWPTDYELTKPLTMVRLEGGRALTWQGHKVNMLCFRTTDKRSLWLFVVDHNALPDAPRRDRSRVADVEGFTTVTWSGGNKTYLLTGEVPPDYLKKLL